MGTLWTTSHQGHEFDGHFEDNSCTTSPQNFIASHYLFRIAQHRNLRPQPLRVKQVTSGLRNLWSTTVFFAQGARCSEVIPHVDIPRCNASSIRRTFD